MCLVTHLLFLTLAVNNEEKIFNRKLSFIIRVQDIRDNRKYIIIVFLIALFFPEIKDL